jgi:endonuclease/exonuclease/phosphatase family metal-dependent hydrolase
MKRLFSIVLFMVLSVSNYAQKTSYFVRTVAFYNVENLFDTINNPNTFDDSRTPNGKDRWNSYRYHEKINKLARVISEIGKERTQQPPDILGIAEIENLNVVLDLTSHSRLRDYNYKIIHSNSPDRRGIDVALIFKEGVFIPIDYKTHRLLLKDEFDKRIYTRDQLVVSGLMDGELLYFLVNHWPSRRGGESKSKYKRIKAAMLNKHIIDSIQKQDSLAKIISMGDFNDDPVNDSFKRILKTKTPASVEKLTDLVNPMEVLYGKGYGSLAYGDSWNLFDQFFFSATLLGTKKSLRFWQARIYNPEYLTLSTGKYKGYPFRTYAGGTYQGGYSDHFPVYLFLIKKQ